MKKVVFMIGSGHSGSTLLGLILGSHPMGFALGEFWSVANWIGDAGSQPSVCGICGSECLFWNEPARLRVLRAYFGDGSHRNWILSKLYNQFGSFRVDIYNHLFEWSGADLLVDSTKAEGWSRRQLRPFWFWREATPFLVFMTRDGRAVTNSYLRKYPDQDMASVAETWAEGMLRREEYFQAFPGGRRMRVAYEELATRPAETVRTICRWLGIDYHPQMLRYWEHDHHLVAGNLGTRSLIFRWREQFGLGTLQGGARVSRSKGYSSEVYYDQVGLAIKLDLRWTDELSAEELEVFRSVAGRVNERYAWEGTGAATARA